MTDNWDGIDRRLGQDNWRTVARILTILGWVLFIVALLVSYYAAPEKSYGYLRYREIEVRESWLTPMTGYLYIILWLSALFSYITILIDNFRARRAEDSKRFNTILLMIISLAWSVYIIFHLFK